MSPRIMCHEHDISEADRDFIRRKVDKLRKFYDRIVEVSVILDSAKHVEMAEILLFGPQLNLRVQAEAEDMRAAFELALNKAERALRKTKNKKWGNKKHARGNVTIRRFHPDALPDWPEEPVDEDKEPAGARAIPVEEVEPKPMSLKEAGLQLQARGQGLMVFVNSETDRVNVIHRNGNDQMELVEFEGEGLYYPSVEMETIGATPAPR